MPKLPATTPLMVACLCAQWCGSCREYRSLFEQVALAFPEMRFVWVDIEDQADLVDPIEVDNFPTLLIADGEESRFFGAITPHKETLLRLLRAHLSTPSAPGLASPELRALVSRLHALGG